MVGVTLAVMIVGAIIAAYTDARTRRIPNLLTGTLAAVAIAASAFSGPASIGTTIVVMLVVFLVGTIAFSLGWFGGGDVKLLAACAGLAGYPGAISVVLYTFLAGGFVVVADALRRRRLGAVVASTVMVASTGVAPAERHAVPYGIAIAVGALVYGLSLTVFPSLRLHL